MYRIVGKENLLAVNNLANYAITVLHDLQGIDKDEVVLDKMLVQRLAQGYLYMYNKSIEHSIMPGVKDKTQFYHEYIQ